MSLYFADNQSKQAAFDRTYNARARSDYAQGRKLQALIKKENIDDALTDQLASLYANTLRKAGEYEYDRISRALKKSAPEILVKGEAPAKSGRTRVYKETEMQTETTTEAPLEEKPAAPAEEIPLEPYPSDPKDVTQDLHDHLAARTNALKLNLNEMRDWKPDKWQLVNPLINQYMRAIIDRRIPEIEETIGKTAQGKWDQSALLTKFPQNIREALMARNLKWPKQIRADLVKCVASSSASDKRKQAYLAYVGELKAFINKHFPGEAPKPASPPAKKGGRKKASPITPEASTARA